MIKTYDTVWYGILFLDESITVKRLLSFEDYKEVQESDFVKETTITFTAVNRADAIDKAVELLYRS